MKQLLLAFFLVLNLFAKGFAQVILNGDFENNTAATCEFNLSNAEYSDKMLNSWGIGPNQELDIQTFTCGYAVPPSRNWFVSLSKIPPATYDELSLKLSSNLIAGNTYKISYLEFSADTFENEIVPLEIGLSTNAFDFGQLIYTSIPILNTWTLRTFSFVAPNNGDYITVRIDSAGTLKGWNFVDNFKFVLSSSNNDLELNAAISIFPNPSNGEFTVSFPADVQHIRVFNSIGQLIVEQKVNGLTNLNLQIEEKGVYLIHVSTDKSRIVKKLIVQNKD